MIQGMTTDERWLPVRGFKNYEVSNLGAVRSTPRHGKRAGKPTIRPGKVLKPFANHKGHLSVGLSRDGTATMHRVHILVLEAFVGPRPEGMLGLHRDDDKLNNAVENLYWGTYSDNAADAVRNGKHYPGSLTECKRGHVIDGVASNGRRYCTICQKANARAWKRAHPAPKAEMPYGRPRLTTEQIDAIKADTRPLRTVADEYGISHTTVRRIRNGLF